MENYWKSQALALGEGALRVKYNGKFKYASVTVAETGGTDASPLISLGVSDTTLAAAVSAMETVFTSTANTDTIDDIQKSIHWWQTSTAGAIVKSGDWSCEVLHAIANSTTDTPYHASAAKFAADAGTTTNFADGNWHDTLLWDNDAAGVYQVSRRVAHPGISKGGVVLAYITGGLAKSDGTTALTSGMQRRIYDDDGNVLYDSGAVAAITSTLDWRTAPVAYAFPVIVRDKAYSSGDYADVDAVTTTLLWDFVRP